MGILVMGLVVALLLPALLPLLLALVLLVRALARLGRQSRAGGVVWAGKPGGTRGARVAVRAAGNGG